MAKNFVQDHGFWRDAQLVTWRKDGKAVDVDWNAFLNTANQSKQEIEDLAKIGKMSKEGAFSDFTSCKNVRRNTQAFQSTNHRSLDEAMGDN